MEPAVLVARARAWMARDPDPDTRAATARMLERRDTAALEACFGQRLTFGTAGIRGRLGPGPGCMNRALVRLVTGGLVRVLLEDDAEGARSRGVVLGRDARRGSEAFADEVAGVLAAAGIPCHVHPGVTATPLLAHSVLHLAAAAGVMVTASHNPPEDNGYKVYAADGAQIVPPLDRRIARAIDALDSPEAVATVPPTGREGLVRTVPAAASAAWREAVLAQRVHRTTGLPAVYTALHGVGWAPLRDLLAAAGHRLPLPVPEQRDPDGGFPTVRFPNPEEPAALDRALALADREGIDLVIANDPDADRLAVAVRTRSGWRRLTGDEVGLLLADDLLAHGPRDAPRLVATTIVSTNLLRRLAAHHGAECVETLTGFKWIAHAAMAWEGRFVLGFEEALGYTVGDVVRDKDGLGAALVLLDLAAWCRARGETLLDRLADIHRRIGYAASAQRAFHFPGPEGRTRIEEAMAALRGAHPATLAGVPVVRERDVLAGTSLDRRTGQETPLDLPRSDVLAWDLADGSRALARPSGTEPKLKLYFEVVEEPAPGTTLAATSRRAAGRLRRLADELVALAGLADATAP